VPEQCLTNVAYNQTVQPAMAAPSVGLVATLVARMRYDLALSEARENRAMHVRRGVPQRRCRSAALPELFASRFLTYFSRPHAPPPPPPLPSPPPQICLKTARCLKIMAYENSVVTAQIMAVGGIQRAVEALRRHATHRFAVLKLLELVDTTAATPTVRRTLQCTDMVSGAWEREEPGVVKPC
jgi:hypothetical protein